MVETMVLVERGDELGEAYRRRITEVYVRAFADDFVAFSRDTGKLADAFEHMLLLERFYVALVTGSPPASPRSPRATRPCSRRDGPRSGVTSGSCAGCSPTW